MLHWCDCGLYKRKLSPSRCVVGLLTSSSPRLARPSHTFRTTEVPSRSTHSFEPVSGRSRRLMCVFQLPNSKSKSCCPSPALSFCAWIFAVPEFVCPNAGTEYPAKIRALSTRPVQISCNNCIFFRPPLPVPPCLRVSVVDVGFKLEAG